MKQKIIIAGGTGFIGRYLARAWSARYEVVILTRQTARSENNSFGKNGISLADAANIRLVKWDGNHTGGWCKELEGAALVVNLTGKPVNCRYTARNKALILNSRVNATNAIGRTIQQCVHPPKLWINAASATIYRHAEDYPQDEYTGEIKDDFSVQVCRQWEQALFEHRTPFTRKVALRMAFTLGSGGITVPFIRLVTCGLGGRMGNGRQMVSWVHIEDVRRMMEWLLEQKEAEGVYNCCSPNPVSNAVWMRTLRRLSGVRFGLPLPVWLLKAGAFIIGTETELLLKSRWVIPVKITEPGFKFQYPLLEDALKQALHPAAVAGGSPAIAAF